MISLFGVEKATCTNRVSGKASSDVNIKCASGFTSMVGLSISLASCASDSSLSMKNYKYLLMAHIYH